MKLFLVVSLALTTLSCSPINQKLGLEDDNFMEELTEEAIHMKTGISVDLSPSSKERK